MAPRSSKTGICELANIKVGLIPQQGPVCFMDEFLKPSQQCRLSCKETCLCFVLAGTLPCGLQ